MFIKTVNDNNGYFLPALDSQVTFKIKIITT
jgi:hypothetical protein